MIEPPQLFTHERLVFDIREIESLATLIMDLAIPIDRALCESFERLVELAGTRDFIIAFSKLQEYMFQIKSNQNLVEESGTIVPPSYLADISEWTQLTHYHLEELEGENLRTGGLIGRKNRSMHPNYIHSDHGDYSPMDTLSVNYFHIVPHDSKNPIISFETNGGLSLSDSDDIDSTFEISQSTNHARSRSRKNKKTMN